MRSLQMVKVSGEAIGGLNFFGNLVGHFIMAFEQYL